MRKLRPFILFLLPWLIAGLVAGGVLIWFIVTTNPSKPLVIALVCGYMLVATVAAWLVAPLAPAKPRT